MDQSSDHRLPTLTADTERLRQELEQLYRTVKSTCSERREPAALSLAGGMVIKGK